MVSATKTTKGILVTLHDRTGIYLVCSTQEYEATTGRIICASIVANTEAKTSMGIEIEFDTTGTKYVVTENLLSMSVRSVNQIKGVLKSDYLSTLDLYLATAFGFGTSKSDCKCLNMDIDIEGSHCKHSSVTEINKCLNTMKVSDTKEHSCSKCNGDCSSKGKDVAVKKEQEVKPTTVSEAKVAKKSDSHVRFTDEEAHQFLADFDVLSIPEMQKKYKMDKLPLYQRKYYYKNKFGVK